MEEDHQLLGAGGPLGQCSRKLISNPGNYGFMTILYEFLYTVAADRYQPDKWCSSVL